MARRSSGGIEIAHIHAVDRHGAAVDVVEAQQQLKHRRFAGARRPDQRDPLAGLHDEIDARERRGALRARIAERDLVENDAPRHRLLQRFWLGGRRDFGLDGEYFADPARRAGRRRGFAPHLRQFAERTRAQHGVKHELRQQTGGHAARQHILGAEPKHRDDAGEDQKNRAGGDEGAQPRRLARGVVNAVGRRFEPRDHRRLRAASLHRADSGQIFAGEGGGVRQRVLREARAPAHRASGHDQRRDDQRNHRQRDARQFRTRHDHHDDGADEHEQIAQGDRGRGSKRRL